MVETNTPKTKASPISLESVITVVISEEIKPRRKDTKVGEIFSKYKTGMTKFGGVYFVVEARRCLAVPLQFFRKQEFGLYIFKSYSAHGVC